MDKIIGPDRIVYQTIHLLCTDAALIGDLVVRVKGTSSSRKPLIHLSSVFITTIRQRDLGSRLRLLGPC